MKNMKGDKMATITEQDYREALNWFAENKGKWKKPFGSAITEFLIPIDEVPPAVIRYVEFQKAQAEEEDNEEMIKKGFNLNG